MKTRSSHKLLVRPFAAAAIAMSLAGLGISGGGALAQSWSEPSSAPPSANAFPPIWNQSSSSQIGSFWLSGSGKLGSLSLVGSSSGTVTVQPAAVAGTWSLTLPASAGTNGQVLSTDGSGNLSWITPAAGGGGLWTASGNNIYNSNSGNVGIGTSTPDARLNVIGNSNTMGGIHVTANNVTDAPWISFGVNGLGSSYDNFGSITNSNGFRFKSQMNVSMIAGSGYAFKVLDPTAATTYFTVASGGNVGIGTTTPNEKLVIGTDLGNLGANTAAVIGDGTADSALYVGQANGIGAVKWSYNATPANASMQIVTAGYANPIKIDASNVILQSAATGNVGIGTANPAALLDVHGTAFLGSSNASQMIKLTNGWSGYPDASSGSEISNDTGTYKTLMLVGNSTSGLGRRVSVWDRLEVNGTLITIANAGIGTTSPGFRLAVGQDMTMGGDVIDGTAQMVIQGASATGKKMLLGYDTNGNGFGFIKAGYQGVTWTPLALQPNGGNVGIGTTAPSQKLDVSGYIRATSGYCIGASCITSWPTGGSGMSGSGTANYVARFTGASSLGNSSIYDNGNVGIGTTSPTNGLLDVESASANKTIYASNSASGNGSAVYGVATGPGFPSGLYGSSTNGYGVYGTGAWGVYAVGSVYGGEFQTSYVSGIGVDGHGDGANGTGVAGTGTAVGVSGYSSGGDGISGSTGATGAAAGVRGSGVVYGVYGTASNANPSGWGVVSANGMFVGSPSGFATLRIKGGTSNPWDIMSAYNYTNSDLLFAMNGSEKIRINGYGILCVGYGAGSCSETGTYSIKALNAIYSGQYVQAAGNMFAVSFIPASDSRLKRNITTLEEKDGLSIINALRPVSFYWKDGKQDQRQQMGLIAQEVEKVLPSAVTANSQGYLGVNYDQLTAPIIRSIQEQQKEIENLRKEIYELRAVAK